MGICHWDRGLITAPETPKKSLQPDQCLQCYLFHVFQLCLLEVQVLLIWSNLWEYSENNLFQQKYGCLICSNLIESENEIQNVETLNENIMNNLRLVAYNNTFRGNGIQLFHSFMGNSQNYYLTSLKSLWNSIHVIFFSIFP